MTDQTPLAIFDAFLSSLPGNGRAVFETQALLNYLPDRVSTIGSRTAEEFRDLYIQHFTDRDGRPDNWFGKVIFLKGMVDWLIWSSLDPEQIKEQEREIAFLNERRAGEVSNLDISEKLRRSREDQRRVWTEKRDEWIALRDGALGYLKLEDYRRDVFIESAERIKRRELD